MLLMVENVPEVNHTRLYVKVNKKYMKDHNKK